ncbi:hypothetical protein AVEN_5802-1, partial [Araneus ventricosus]
QSCTVYPNDWTAATAKQELCPVTKCALPSHAPTPSEEGTTCHRDVAETTPPVLCPPGKRDPLTYPVASHLGTHGAPSVTL